MVRSRKLVKDMMFNTPKDLPKAYDIIEGFIAIKETMGSLKLNSIEKLKDREMNNHPKSDNNNKLDNQSTKNFSGGSGGGRPPSPN